LVACKVRLRMYGSGARHRLAPIGDWAYGIPRYAETSFAYLPVMPETRPLVVLMGAPSCNCGRARPRITKENRLMIVRRETAMVRPLSRLDS
jgi:hypothetical protein